MDFTEFMEFQAEMEDRYGRESFTGGRKKFDHLAHLRTLNSLAERLLALPPGARVMFKTVYNTKQSVPLDKRKKQIHTLIFRVCMYGKVYSAGIKRRLSLGMNDRGGGRWHESLKEAYMIAVSKPPVGLDPILATSQYKMSCTISDGSIRTLVLRGPNSRVVVSSRRGITSTSGPREEIRAMLLDLRAKGLSDTPPPTI